MNKILLVDDDLELTQLLTEILTLEGFQVTVAEDGEEGLQRLAEQHFNLVLLDVMMPLKTGFEVCASVRADPALAHTRILMLSAKGRDTDLAKGMALGADAYMTKPFATRELVAKVATMLAQERA